MGIIPAANSSSAICTGSISVAGTSVRIGAPSEICNARAPRMRARSKRVKLSGETGPAERSDNFAPLGAARAEAAGKGSPT
jgi:hypothetical protein